MGDALTPAALTFAGVRAAVYALLLEVSHVSEAERVLVFVREDVGVPVRKGRGQGIEECGDVVSIRQFVQVELLSEVLRVLSQGLLEVLAELLGCRA